MGRFFKAHTGQVSVIFAMALLGLVGFVALSIDGGYIMAERRQAQNAADAAALAAAKSLFDGQTGSIAPSGQGYAALNSGALPGDVDVSWPPATGTYSGDDKYVQVTLSKEVRKFFVGAVYGGDWKVSASATAGIEKEPANYALIALSEDNPPGIHLNGNTGIDVSGDNGSAMSNTTITSTGTASFTTDGSIDANGSIQTAGGTWSDEIRPNSPIVDDPLAGMAYPPKGDTRNYPTDYCKNDCTIEPGYYHNGLLNIDRTATMKPGVYYLENFDMVLQNTNSTLRGDNVLLFMTGGTIVFDSKNGNVDLSASPTPLYPGGQANLLFWYTRCTTVDMQGNGNLHFEGIFYAPCADVILHGNPGSETIDGQIFVGTLEVVGTSDVGITYRNLVDTERPRVFLVE
jgi:Flp pilus assembly protein TadG